jgi:integrative and conjugative element protein (TIGR02256 family)
MDAKGLRSDRARAVFDYVERSPDHPFARVVAVATEGAHDVLDIVVEPELPQDRAVTIRPAEPIRVHFPLDDGRAPTIHSRRDDFPLNQVHTNYAPDSEGLCLCIWEENWNNLRRVLSAQALIERIRDWFSRMAVGELHQEGQALEPLLPAGAHTLIIPPGRPADSWYVSGARQHEGRWTITVEPGSATSKEAEAIAFSVFAIQLAPQVHGSLHAQPRNLKELCDLAQNLGTDLVGPIRQWLLSGDRTERPDQRSMIVCLTIPKVRQAGDGVEGYEVRAFRVGAKLSQLGEAFGCSAFDPGTGRIGALLFPGKPHGLDNILLEYLSVTRRLDRDAARFYAGSDQRCDRRLVAIGAGAIGSNVVIGTARAGLGTWTIVDSDLMLPHNTLRQFQGNWAVGDLKADALAVAANHVLADTETAQSITADVLNPDSKAGEIRDAIKQADLVVDFSASPAVLGYISNQSDMRRAGSFFFSPDGSDLVILAEDERREVRLDEIEAQYFFAVATDGRLAGHFDAARVDFIRYANACQDLTRRLPPWQVQTLSAIAGGQLIALVERAEPAASVWRLDVQTGGVSPVSLSVSAVDRFVFDDWRLTVSRASLDLMRRWRAEMTPRETGGILLGTVDLSRRIAHVVGVLPAPPDSEQEPTYFVRGKKDLGPRVERLGRASAGVLRYLGEWHSHPDNVRPRPSSDDTKVYSHLERHIGPTGAPYLIAIRGRDETWFRLGSDGCVRGEAVIRDDGE